MDRFTDVVQDKNGRVISGASVLVLDEGGLPAEIFETREGTLKDNPFLTDSLGKLTFCAADGLYSVQVTVNESLYATLPDIRLDDPEEGAGSGDFGTVVTDVFSGTGAQTVFTLAAAPKVKDDTQVYVGGAYQKKSTYTIVGTALTFTVAPVAGTANIEVVTITPGTAAATAIEATAPAGQTGTNVQALINSLAGTFASNAAVLASAGGGALVGVTPVGGVAATTVQGAIAELDSEKMSTASLAAAGGAALVGITPVGGVAATTVQAAIAELDTEKATTSALSTGLALKVAIADLIASAGTSLIGFIQAGAGAVMQTLQAAMRERAVSVTQFGADPTGVADSTAAFNAAITASTDVFIPPGIYLLNAVTGVFFRTGLRLRGAGKNKTILVAATGGGTISELASYSRGSVLRRKFNPDKVVTGGTWTLATPFVSTDGAAHYVRLYNNTTTNHSAKTVTLTGTDAAGAPQSEVLAMPTSSLLPGGRVVSANLYKTLVSAVPSATIGADTMELCLENPYLNDMYLADFSIVTTHPLASVTSTAIQIGIDLRNVTRSLVERVHVGNIAPIGGAYTKTVSGNYEIQGYNIVIGNVSSGQASYCGGEVNTIRSCSSWGAYKTLVIDDATLSPNSSAHATAVVSCDLQAAHHLLVQESQYTAGTSLRDNTLQSSNKQPGDASTSFVVRAEGYNQEMSGGYIEAGSGADYLLYLGASSKTNKFRLSYYSATSAAAITDAGTKNEVEYFENSGSIAGGVDSFGQPVRLYDRAHRRAWVKFHWDGSAIVIDGGQGATVSRTGAGDYTITWSKPFSSANYSLSSMLDTDISGHMAGVTVGSHSASNVRIYTYQQNAGTTTIIDPRFVWVRAEQ